MRNRNLSQAVLNFSLVTILFVYPVFLACPVLARLGENIYEFKFQQSESYQLKKIVLKDDLKYYFFNLLVHQSELAKAPGFKGGMTVTVENGLIVSQSLALSLGSNNSAGMQLAVKEIFQFSCEALGRVAGGEQEKNEKEFELFEKAIGLALKGQPQELKFPDAAGKLVLKKGKNGNLLIAALP